MTTATLVELYRGVKEFLTDERRAQWHVSGKAPAERSSPADRAGLTETMKSGLIVSRSEAINRTCGDHMIIHHITDPNTKRVWMCFEGTYCSVCEVSSICLCSFFPDWSFLIPNLLGDERDHSDRSFGYGQEHQQALSSFEDLLALARNATRTVPLKDAPAFLTGLEHLCACLKEMPGRTGCAVLPWSAAAAQRANGKPHPEDGGGDQGFSEPQISCYKTEQLRPDRPAPEETAR